MNLYRYATANVVYSPRDPLSDLLVWLDFLTSKDYVTEVLTSKHGLTKSDASKRALRVCPHVKVAAAYIGQALDGPPDVAFLPSYYAVLNLLKVYIICSALHHRLHANRWHGVTYDVYAKESHSLRTEEITLRNKGAVPLFYEAITGRTITDGTSIPLSDVYPFLVDVNVEWRLASGALSKARPVEFDVVAEARGRRPRAAVGGAGKRVDTRQLKLLTGFRRAQRGNVFTGKLSREPNDALLVRSQINTALLYHPSGGVVLTPISGKNILLIEELPITLMFFHMGAIVRYKPEFLARIRDSRYWPVVSAARWHSLVKLLCLFWSYVQQGTVVLQHEFNPGIR
jgi:hypothetical protein